eukprot:CAMPEP_0206369410 /NCGR_PEP_ID=MMETSP0294-20121207/5285_1 /ASSEMBLY_ACC=CAM_ASM_000327 /TAXON_ID=39354 /ORGANISM="Heterosigma akashiwo, Strain CCMP2393" /LENGTH=541 /DNA_ID=CAMNT_0053816169 /DNA_START=65 /DNA_END=1687 /DNA_ORIENTATION=-
MEVIQKAFATTQADVQKFQHHFEELHTRGEEARALRDRGRLAEAEKVLLILLEETEHLCGKESHHMSDVLKSLGILFTKLGRHHEAEKAFVRMDWLRSRGKQQGVLVSDLEWLIPAQLSVQRFTDAQQSLERLRSLTSQDDAYQNAKCQQMILAWENQAAGRSNVQQTCASCGQSKNLRVYCGGCRTISFCSMKCQKRAWKTHKLACRAIPSKDAQNGNHQDENQNGTFDDLLDAIRENAASSSAIRLGSPSSLSEPLKDALRNPDLCYFFRMGDVCSSRLLRRRGSNSPRFLATPGVLACIAVFAWAPPNLAVAAHVSLNDVLRGIRAVGITGQDLDRVLPPLTNELWESFRGVDPTTVSISFVGGHRVTDRQECLRDQLANLPVLSRCHEARNILLNDPRENFSWYIRAACEGAGLKNANFNTELLNAFEGEPCVNAEVEMKLRMANTRFEYVAMDTHTGLVVTHTRYIETPEEHLLTQEEELRQQQAYGSVIGGLTLDDAIELPPTALAASKACAVCEAPNSKLCSNCRRVCYCSAKC